MPAGVWIWTVNDDAAVDIQAVLLHGTDNSDNRDLSIRIKPHVFADRIAVRPETLREFLIDQTDEAGVRRHVQIVEDSTLYQRNLHRPKIVWSRGPLIDLKLLARLRRPAF